MNSKLPYFKFFVSDYLSGNVQGLSHEEQGIFVNLLCLIWKNGGKLKVDEALRRRLRLEEHVFNTCLHVLTGVDVLKNIDGFLEVDFINEQLSEREKLREKKVRAGKVSASKRTKSNTCLTPVNGCSTHAQHLSTTLQSSDKKNICRKSPDVPTACFSLVDSIKKFAIKNGRVAGGDRSRAANTIRLMSDKDHIPFDEIKAKFERYMELYTGESYQPEIFSAKTLRNKWNKLLSFLEREDGGAADGTPEEVVL
jgi:uncharacterized protein YdaU (DUF1376 family)